MAVSRVYVERFSANSFPSIAMFFTLLNLETIGVAIWGAVYVPIPAWAVVNIER